MIIVDIVYVLGGLTIGLAINHARIRFHRWKIRELEQRVIAIQQEHLKITLQAVTGTLGAERFEKLAHAVNALKTLEEVGVVSPEVFPGARDIIKEADKVILENNLCPGWYRS